MKNPIYGLIAFFMVEGLIALGFISRSDAKAAQSDMENIIFFIVLSVTGLFGFRQYIGAHKHQITEETKGKIKECKDENDALRNLKITTTCTEGNSGTPPLKTEN
jgi:hypothetical protein